jgi:hypothetical protein
VGYVYIVRVDVWLPQWRARKIIQLIHGFNSIKLMESLPLMNNKYSVFSNKSLPPLLPSVFKLIFCTTFDHSPDLKH